MTKRRRILKSGAVGAAIAGLLFLAGAAGCEFDDSLPEGGGEQCLALTNGESEDVPRYQNASLVLEGPLAGGQLERTPAVTIGGVDENPWQVHYAADSGATYDGNLEERGGPEFDPNPIPATSVQEAIESDSQGSDGQKPPSMSTPRLSDPNPIPAGL
jgi:hypothetical protein